MAVGTVVLLSLVCCVAYAWVKSRSGSRLPPGPKGIPFLGNAHQMPQEYLEKTFAGWAKQYGDLVYAKAFGKPIVVVNSLQAAQDLMEKRGAKYSDRPKSRYFDDMVEFKPLLVLLSFDERGRRHRRWYQAALETKSVLDSFIPLQIRERDRLLLGLLKSPTAFVSLIKMFAGAVMLEIAYGHTVDDVEDEYIKSADEAIVAMSTNGSIFTSLVDIFPLFLHLPAWLPGCGFKREGLRVRAMARKMLDAPFDRLRDALASGSAKDCFTTFLMKEMSPDGKTTTEQNDDIKGAAAQVYVAGSDSTITTLLTFILMMVLHPDVFRKAQAEVDQVIGTGRLPELEDRGSMPYFECVLMEVYRWNPAIPLGIAHATYQEDNYRGYTIPSGSTVISNIWAMGRDDTNYPDPESFRPERFEEMDPKTLSQQDPRKYIFGFGRRLCPGRYLADSSIWLIATSILSAFTLAKARNSKGEEITPEIVFAPGVFSPPEPFLCDIRPRSQAIADVITRHKEDDT